MKSWLFASRVGVVLFAMAACAWGNDEWREFRNAEGGQSFVGRVVSYDPARREAQAMRTTSAPRGAILRKADGMLTWRIDLACKLT